jgi:hypothetical protein
MRVVLYTRDFEPITVLEIPMWLLDQLEKQGTIKIAVAPTLKSLAETFSQEMPPMPEVIDIYCRKLRWEDGTLKTILITNNDELALALRPEWLPGQQQAINWYHRTIHGLVDQLHKAMKNR